MDSFEPNALEGHSGGTACLSQRTPLSMARLGEARTEQRPKAQREGKGSDSTAILARLVQGPIVPSLCTTGDYATTKQNPHDDPPSVRCLAGLCLDLNRSGLGLQRRSKMGSEGEVIASWPTTRELTIDRTDVSPNVLNAS
ncbi:hypothetical protein CEP51_005661 [Fusarium floridanum]|uniref:Uncharacterized protein n=1 Tax=Fusarium floridanum TaxID=1325733 RepID=A0A428RVY7_9HYPO|nr:hypothetical protein CEP51_005661 [Fusarium floridanum]